MKKLIAGLVVAFVGLALVVNDADASRRAGGGKNVGAQRDGVSQRQAAPQQQGTPAQAAPAQAAPAAAAAAPAGAAAAATKSGMGRWLAPLAGLAIGLGLASLFGEQLGSILMAVLLGLALVVAVVFVMRMLSRNRSAPQAGDLRTAAAGAGAGAGYDTPSGTQRLPRIGEGLQGAAAQPQPQATAAVPPGFNVAGFLEQAKGGFLALQAANDRADIESLRDMTSDAMFDMLKREIESRGGAAQKVEVAGLHADLLEVVTEGPVHWASVRFSGTIREDGGQAESFEEIWNLQKPTDGSSGWLVAGIQQVN